MIIDPTNPNQNKTQTGTPQVDLSKTTELACECENDMFMPVMKFRKTSAITSPTGKAAIIPVEVYMCTACGTIPDELDYKL